MLRQGSEYEHCTAGDIWNDIHPCEYQSSDNIITHRILLTLTANIHLQQHLATTPPIHHSSRVTLYHLRRKLCFNRPLISLSVVIISKQSPLPQHPGS